MYANCRGVLQDDKEAVKWYRLAVELTNPDAQFNLGVMYEMGRGVPQDDKQAVELFREAAWQGHVLARTRFNKMKEEEARRKEVEQTRRREAEQVRRIAKEQYQKIFDACLLDKSSGVDVQVQSLLRAVERACEAIAQDPSWIDRLRYD